MQAAQSSPNLFLRELCLSRTDSCNGTQGIKVGHAFLEQIAPESPYLPAYLPMQKNSLACANFASEKDSQQGGVYYPFIYLCKKCLIGLHIAY